MTWNLQRTYCKHSVLSFAMKIDSLAIRIRICTICMSPQVKLILFHLFRWYNYCIKGLCIRRDSVQSVGKSTPQLCIYHINALHLQILHNWPYRNISSVIPRVDVPSPWTLINYVKKSKHKFRLYLIICALIILVHRRLIVVYQINQIT